MPTPNYTPPTFGEQAFHCPQCGTYAHQRWARAYLESRREPKSNLQVSMCVHCNKDATWIDGAMVHPTTGSAPLPHSDMPEEIAHDFEEARSIASRSARGAAALLRLVIQKLCIHLGESGRRIDEDIASLVQKGLPERVQKVLDTVRVIGNEAVHPGTIDLRDNPEMAQTLFKLVNIIVEKMISEPREIDELYESLPQTKRDAIAKRDEKAKSLTAGGALA